MKDPEFRAEYDALEEEFALASALIRARGEADITQEEVAKAMGTTQAVAEFHTSVEKRNALTSAQAKFSLLGCQRPC